MLPAPEILAANPPAANPRAVDLLAWYDRHRRNLPWRAPPGETADPYRVWLSEIMLQQTTVGAVKPYYERFLARFPDVRALAAAPDEAVMHAWAGLGYYARARNLHACSKAVAALGAFPRDLEGLRALPGIGPYTASAIGAIAFGIPTVPIDGNVERVMSRVFAIEQPLPSAKPAIAAAAARVGEQTAARERPSDFAQALFDLGATICAPATALCAICPWAAACDGRRSGIAETLPRKAPKKARPVRHGAHFWLVDACGRVLLRRRPPKGLFGGMIELPGTEWRAAPWGGDEALVQAPMKADWRAAGEISHVLTHFELRLRLFSATVASIPASALLSNDFLSFADRLDDEALPSVMRKCVAETARAMASETARAMASETARAMASETAR